VAVRRLFLLALLAAFLAAPAYFGAVGRDSGSGRGSSAGPAAARHVPRGPSGRSDTPGGHAAARPTVCGQALPSVPTARAPIDELTGTAPNFDSPRGPRDFEPDAAAFRAILDRTGARVLMARFSTNFYHATPSQEANIALTARRLTGVVVQPGAVFSYNRTVGPYTEANGYGWGRMFVGTRIVPTIGGGVCQGASTLYNVVLLADLPVVERHPHGLTVPYLEPGRDATVTDQGGLDFRFRNDTSGPLVLWGQARDRILTLAIYGTQPAPPVRIRTELLERLPFRTEVVADPNLPAGEERVVAPGQEGARSRTWIEVETSTGWVRRDLHRDTYSPSPRVILRGTGERGPEG
jgi:vancomycin resistance protein VanW